ncbi:unnamed protein product [Cyclocybe aegerita]|uniref:Uncharacterized protein n=1 Tax=Cyclocybe aegerita TaxID=1973307 RepID=A0A8S0X453_CYCAE|nr:unnamed protein product [Cyclocybe aegerita]
MTDDGKRRFSTLEYPVKWADRVFSSRATTEALLAPEREAGNLTSHDYDAILNFHSGGFVRRNLPLVLFLASSTGAALTIKRPKWSPLQRNLVVLSFGAGGWVFGAVNRITSYSKFLGSIENPAGFKKALHNIQNQVGVPLTGPVLVRPYQPSPDEIEEQDSTTGKLNNYSSFFKSFTPAKSSTDADQ